MRQFRWLLAGSLCLPTVSAWADQPATLFSETNHDFGSVARAAKVEYRFKLKNIYNQDLHIVNVRSSCGCTLPRAEKDTLAPGEEGSIIAAFNTQGFTGNHGAQVTVTFDKPNWHEVQLHVHGRIRTDVVVSPSQVSLGSVDLGKAIEKQIRIEYAGRNDWKILEVKSPSPHITATVAEKSRANGRVSYELQVKLDDQAPAGYLRDQLEVVTNDHSARQFPVNVEGLVVEELTVSPKALTLGIIHPGDTVTKQIVIKGKKPFRVLSVQCENSDFAFKTGEDAKAVHLIPVTFTASTAIGKLNQKIVIVTDLDGKTVELNALGQVVAPLAGN